MAEDNTLKLVDETLRDGSQSLWGMLTSYHMSEPVIGEMGEVGFGATLGGLDDGLSGQGLYAEEDVRGPAALVLVVHACWRAWGSRYGDSSMFQQLLARLVDAYLRSLGVIWATVDLEHVLHRRNERGVLFRRDAEPLRSPRFQLVFFLNSFGRSRS